ncbi:drug/metabolite transporter (DMT)-like permease [Oxalobacteraceae bacterium GrIS 1.11]
MTHQLRGILALLVVTLVWGTTFPAMKSLTAYFSPIWIVFIRFLLAAAVLAPCLWRARWSDCREGAVVGVLLFACYVFQVEGLALTSSNRNAFLTGLNVLAVPLLGFLAGKRPERRIMIALVLAVAGLCTLCSDGAATWGRGDTLALLAAFSFGVYVKLMEGATRRVEKLMTLTAMQIVTVALCSALWLLVREVPRGQIDASVDLLNYWSYIGAGLRLYALNFLYLGLLCTAAIIALQTWGQSHSTANEAAVIYAFEPGAAAFFAYFWLGEVMSAQAWAGAALLISGMIASQWNSARPATVLAPE